MAMLEKITVIGSGLMGHGIAQVFASEGHPVWIVDVNEGNLDEAKKNIYNHLISFEKNGIALKFSVNEILSFIHTTTNMEVACQDSDYVIEAVFENLELKQGIFEKLDRICRPDTVLCSNTSVISITQIASKAEHRDRIIGMHFWNPPHLIPLVEIVRAQESADRYIEKAYELLTRVGKRPVHVHKDVPGFIGNRLQHILWREAFYLIDQGICDPEAIDEVVRNGFGLRMSVLGPMENADMIGLDLTLSIHHYLLSHLSGPTPSTTLREKVKEGKLGFKTNEGFQKWSKAQIEESRERLANHLIRQIAEKRI